MPQHAQSGRRTFGMRVCFIDSHIFFTICLCIYFYLRYKAYSNPVKQTKSFSTKRKEYYRRFPPEIILFVLVTTLYTTSLVPLPYSNAGVSLPIPLSAANRLSRSTISNRRFHEMMLTTKFKTLRKGDADLRFYITTVQGG